MPRRTFDRSTSSESNVIDMNTRKPAAKNMMPVICERIRFYRKQMGMEQKTLARMVGVTECRMQLGERMLSSGRQSSAGHL